jgi:hypothetical protein
MSASAPPAKPDFAPALRFARNLGEDRFVGLEYYADFGKIGDFLPVQQQSQQLFAVTDFKVSAVEVELGAGYGFTPGSDRFVFKGDPRLCIPGVRQERERQRAEHAAWHGHIGTVAERAAHEMK